MAPATANQIPIKITTIINIDPVDFFIVFTVTPMLTARSFLKETRIYWGLSPGVTKAGIKIKH
jgi:hypothetical protein